MGPKGVPSCLVRFPNSWYTRGSGNLTIPFPASFSQRRSVTRFKPAPRHNNSSDNSCGFDVSNENSVGFIVHVTVSTVVT